MAKEQGAKPQEMVDTALGTAIRGGGESLESLADRVTAGGINPRPRSGRQEKLENWVNRFT